MIKHNSHYIIAGLEDFQPNKVSANLWLEASLFNIYKYLFRLGRKDGEPITKDLQKAVNNCEFFLSETLKHHSLLFQGGEFLQTKTPEDKIAEYLERWQKVIKECKEFEEPELVSHFVETIVVYFYCYTSKKEKIQYSQVSEIETYSNGAEFMQKRMEALKGRIEKANQGISYQKYVDISDTLNKK